MTKKLIFFISGPIAGSVGHEHTLDEEDLTMGDSDFEALSEFLGPEVSTSFLDE